MRSTFDKLSDILIEQLGVEPSEIDTYTRIIEDLGAESLNIAEIIMAIVREWNLEIDESTAEAVITVGEVVALIDNLCL